MDPNEAVQQLRELYNEFVQDEGLQGRTQGQLAADLIEVLVLFDDLDNWIIAGGFLPKEWQR